MEPLLTAEQGKTAETLYNKGRSHAECATGARLFQAIKSRQWHSAPVKVKSFSVDSDSSLPALAWLCEINGAEYRFTVGQGVETGETFIVEGVWDGDFTEARFDEAEHFYGSGARLDSDGVCVFVPPRLCTDYLFVLHDKKKSRTSVSNSFNFIFTVAEISLDGDFYRTFKSNLNKTTNEESALGADRGSPLIAENDHFAMYRMMYHNFTVDMNGNINYMMRIPAKKQISSYTDYKRFILEKIESIIANGTAPERKNPFGTVSMLSTGYDSCATSALCAQCGVKEAVTLDVVVGGHNDCGENIAKALGMECRKVQSPLGKNVPVLKAAMARDCDLLEFVATAGIGDNVVFKTMEPILKGKIVFSGLYGDGCWSKEGNGSGLAHHLPYMKSRTEFRLRTGYCLVPVPALGAYFPYFLDKINSSPEMDPWRLNNHYDRPIPRRMAEEAGVPRNLFGMRKAANNPDIVNYQEVFDDAVRFTMKRYEKCAAHMLKK